MRYTVTLSLSTAVLPQFGVLHECSSCTNSKKVGAAEQPLQLSPNVAAWALLDLVWLYTITDDRQARSKARVLHCVQAAEIRFALETRSMPPLFALSNRHQSFAAHQGCLQMLVMVVSGACARQYSDVCVLQD